MGHILGLTDGSPVSFMDMVSSSPTKGAETPELFRREFSSSILSLIPPAVTKDGLLLMNRGHLKLIIDDGASPGKMRYIVFREGDRTLSIFDRQEVSCILILGTTSKRSIKNHRMLSPSDMSFISRKTLLSNNLSVFNSYWGPTII